MKLENVAFNKINLSSLFIIFYFFYFPMYAQSPGGVSNCVYWFKSDAGVYSDAGVTTAIDGATVQQWNDQSGNNYHITQATLANKPIYNSSTVSKLINFNPSLSFNSSSLKNTTAFMANTSNYTFINVGLDEGVSNASYRIITDCAANNPDYFGIYKYYVDGTNTYKSGWLNYRTLTSGNNYFNANGNSFSNANGTNAYYNGTNYTSNSTSTQSLRPQIIGLSSPASTALNTYIDGIKGTQTLANSTNTNFFNGLSIGAEVSGAEAWLGRIPEVCAFNTQLTDPDIQKVNSYLAIKYGITLGTGGSLSNLNNNAAAYNYISSNGTVVWNATANSGYNFNIGAIARDDNSALHQKQSNSINSGIQVLIGNGASLYNNNSVNTNTFSANQSFEIWGDNGAATTYTILITGSANVNYRMSRVWKVQETGTVNTVMISWPLKAANICLVTNNSDPTFSSGNTFIPLTAISINNRFYFSATVDLANNSYFTFASYGPQSPGGVLSGLSFWSKSDYNLFSDPWPDNSPNSNDIEVMGNMSIAAADVNHNFHPYYTSFSGSNYFLEKNCSFAANGAYTQQSLSAFSAIRPTSATTAGRITGIDNNLLYAAEPHLSLTSTGKPRYYKYSGTTNSFNHSNSVVANSNSLSHFVTNDVTKQIDIGLNGLLNTIILSAGNTFGNWGPNMQIGYGTFDVNGSFPGDIMEIIWYNRAVSATEQLRINSYLAIKYGITLDQTLATSYLASDGTTVVWNATTNSGYNNSIIGIAKDDISGLDQKQSHSITNDVLTIYLGATKETNTALNNSSFSGGNMSFFLAGSNGQAVVNTISPHPDLPAGVAARLKRVWKSQQTNFSNTNLALEFDLSALAVGSINANDLRLMIDADGVFATGANLYGNGTTPSVNISVAGNVVTVKGVSAAWFSSANFFTIGSTSSTTPLPIELLYFTATAVNNTTDLSWATATETNNKYFTIERSNDGITFDAIKQVNSEAFNGNSITRLNYKTYDMNPYSGISYYRLKQIDVNGNYKNSNIESVYVGYQAGLKVLPNPFNGICTIYFNESQTKKTVEIFNPYGVLVKTIYVNTGHERAIQIDLSDLPSGLYYLKINTSNQTIKLLNIKN